MNGEKMKWMSLIVTMLWLSGSVGAQQSEGQLTIKLSRSINGETQVFEGTYENEAQMMSDPNYRDFVGSDQMTNSLSFFNFPGFSSNMMVVDSGSMMKQFSFDIDVDSMMEGDESMQMMIAQLQNLHEQMKPIIDQAHAMNIVIDENEEFIIDGSNSSNVRVEDVMGDEFGKKGKVKDNELLEVEKLTFSPNPSAGLFRLGFKVPEQDRLQVVVYDLGGDAVYERSFDQFGGYFSEMIDLSTQSGGNYLLEIQLGKKRLVKKVIID